MKAVIQRVTSARVEVDGRITGEIGKGFLVLLGVMQGDTCEQAELLARKTAALRIFEDEDGKMNKSLNDVDGAVLAVSQFTLCADVRKGNRPSFIASADPQTASSLYEHYMLKLRENGIKNVQSGEFAADMQVSLVNDGPVTICYDTDIWAKV
ncbi:MAG: D-tyrosyl-tRNA(Tyr) deacylase [Clostridiales bacterium]|nr:D-tyrosyl-tRNA(Tyr) deacylase [Clostridiales bacterium]